MKRILSLVIFLLTAAMTFAQDAKTIDGIFITVSNSETCYKLEDMPKIVRREAGGQHVADVLLQGSDTPVLSIPLSNGADVRITFGTYVASETTAIQDATVAPLTITTDAGRKYLRGGRLIIVKDGKCYDANGKPYSGS